MTISTKDLEIAEREIAEEQQLKESLNNEEFKIWKKTVPLLYDTIHTQALDFPSLSVQWLPDYTVSDNKNEITVRFLFGTNTSGYSQDYLKLGSLKLPSTLASDFPKFSPNTQSIPLPFPNDKEEGGFQLLSTWRHDGEINSIRLSPNYNNVITFDNQGIVHLFDLQSKDSVEFAYHKLEGYALEWIDDHQFLSGSNDSQIALWEVSKPSTPMQLFKSHNAVVSDLSYNSVAKNIFGSVADDHTTQFHDLRSLRSEDNPAITVQNKHIQNAISFHPEIDTLFSTAGKDNVVSLFDLRNPKVPFRKLFGHNDSVSGLKWNITDPSQLVSWSLDKRVIIWDLNKLDEDFSYPNPMENNKKSTKADPCLYFIHGGHTQRINDFDVHPKIQNLFATVGDDQLFEIWKPKTIIPEEDEDMEDVEDDQNDQMSPAPNNDIATTNDHKDSGDSERDAK
ncbi:uncharacterized protein PRCAT00000613001 [Priceomyces carsonii]|uniref:uncharacterized protein n=1 Tax=Priceomyces carsonii TaxID=28549 RepID=UPI002EDA1D30|nr:unnamed protein product [Priceomyces carsonii]